MTQDPEKNDIAVCVDAQPIAARSENELSWLPEKEYISTDDDKFYDEAVKLLPTEIQNEVRAHARSQSIKYSRWEILLCFVIAAVLCVIAYCFILPGKEADTVVSIVPRTEVEGKQEKILHKKMEDLLEKKQYQACIDCLPEDKLKDIISNKTKLMQNTYALTVYLNAVFMANGTQDAKAGQIKRAQELCCKLVELNPDYPDWHIHKLRFDNFYIVSGYADQRLGRIDIQKKDPQERDRLKRQVEYMESIRSEAFTGELQKVFDQSKCKIYIAYWLNCLAFDNYHDKRPDNRNGLEERLRAYDLCRKYENNPEFLKLREFIIRKIKARRFFSDYFFDDTRDLWRDTVLNKELAYIEELKKLLAAQEN